MSNFGVITDWFVLPICYIEIHFTSVTHTFSKILESSFLEVAPILEDNDTGGQTIVGYNINCEWTPIENKLEQQLEVMHVCRSSNIAYVVFHIRLFYPYTTPIVIVTSDQSSLVVKSWNMSWRTKSGTDTDITYNLKGTFDINLDESSPASGITKLFTEYNF